MLGRVWISVALFVVIVVGVVVVAVVVVVVPLLTAPPFCLNFAKYSVYHHLCWIYKKNYTFDTCLCGGLCVNTEAGKQDKGKVEVYSLLRAYSKRFQLAVVKVVVQ
jgi:hypothetical protein